VLLEEGADPSRVLISHLDAAYSLDFKRDLRIAEQGFFIGYDHTLERTPTGLLNRTR